VKDRVIASSASLQPQPSSDAAASAFASGPSRRRHYYGAIIIDIATVQAQNGTPPTTRQYYTASNQVSSHFGRLIMSRIAPNHKRERSKDEPTGRDSRRQRMEEGEVNKSLFDLVTRDLHSRNTAILEEAMKLLRDAVSDHDDRKLAQKQDELFDLGGHATVVRVMSDHPNSKTIQKYGLRVLMSATHRNNEMRTAVAKVNGIQVILHAMKTFYAYQDLVFFGFKALKSLCYLAANSELVVHRFGAVPFLLDMMKRFSKDASITEVACDLIFEMCGNARLRKQLLAAKTASVIAAAFENHPTNPSIQDAAREAMNVLTYV